MAHLLPFHKVRTINWMQTSQSFEESGASMTVQFGAHVGAQNATVEELRTLWKWLDSAGMDWISLWDHLYEAPPAGGTQVHFEAFSMLGALIHQKHVLAVWCSARNTAILDF
jgi:hypothetical protein